MSRPLKPHDLGKRSYWGTAGLIGLLLGTVIGYFTKSDVWPVGGIVVGLLGGFAVAAIRKSDEL
jgi:hypothetical protein